MVLLEDTRNKIGKHKNVQAYCAKHGIELVRECLDVGDYMLPDGKISVDTKKDLSELATNLLNPQDKKRFMREIKRASEAGIQLVVLCEHGGKIKCLQDVALWESAYSPVKGRALVNAMHRLTVSYGVKFEFCSKRSTGKRIVEILEGREVV